MDFLRSLLMKYNDMSEYIQIKGLYTLPLSTKLI